jgi:prophage antirepressor-like protein
MVIVRMSNPQNFCKEAEKLNIRYEFLKEAIECVGGQALARMFNGTSLRGGGNSISSATICNWLLTFEFIKENPDHNDNDQYCAHRLEPKDEYYEYIKIITQPIEDDIVKSWKILSNKKLGDEAQKYGITLGIRNSKAIKNLLERMLNMVERRKENIWNKVYDEDVEGEFDYRFTNVPELRRLCKERNLKNAHLKSKEELIDLLKNNTNRIYDNSKKDYTQNTKKELKKLAKERGLTRYNHLKKDELVKLHNDYDEDIEMINEDEENINKDIKIINEIENDDKEENKSYEDIDIDIEIEYENEEIKINNEKESVIIQQDKSVFGKIFKFDNKQIRTTGTIEEPLFAVKDIADILELGNYRNVYSKMDEYMKGVQKMDTLGGVQEMQVINESGLYYMIMRSNKPNAKLFQKYVYSEILPSIRKTGSYTIDNKYKFILENNRPLSQVMNITDMDKEALNIEKTYNWSKNTNCPIVYIAYIGGEGLVKIGFSDSKFDERVAKHISCESKYQQFIILTTFEVSGKPIEDILHNLLNKYRHIFDKQKEIYKPTTTLNKFIEYVKQLLDDNDYKLKYNILEKKYLELENLNIKVQLELKTLRK